MLPPKYGRDAPVPAPGAHQNAFMAKHQQIWGDKIINGAEGLQPLLEREVGQVASRLCGARMLRTPPKKDGEGKLVLDSEGRTISSIKSRESAERKVKSEYGGNWISMRDMARCTLVVPGAWMVSAAMFLLKDQFRPGNPSHIVLFNSKTVNAWDEGNKAGYSGWTILVSLEGHNGEVQVNTPEMMYAKDLPQFKAAFPDRLEEMRQRFPAVPGGVGHALYEVSRDQGQPEALRAAYDEASRAYYDYFRSRQPTSIQGKQAFFKLFHLGLVNDPKFIDTKPQLVADELKRLREQSKGYVRKLPRP